MLLGFLKSLNQDTMSLYLSVWRKATLQTTILLQLSPPVKHPQRGSTAEAFRQRNFSKSLRLMPNWWRRPDFSPAMKWDGHRTAIGMVPTLVTARLPRLGKTESGGYPLELPGSCARHAGFQSCRREAECLFRDAPRRA